MSDPANCPRCGALFADDDEAMRHLLREHTLAGASEQLGEAVSDFLRAAGVYRLLDWIAARVRRAEVWWWGV